MIYDCDREFKSEKLNDFNDGSPDCKNEDYSNTSFDMING